MNISEQAQRAYAPTNVPLQTPRSIEARLFMQITAKLTKAKANPADYPFLVSVLHENRRMWTTLAADLADNDNDLPASLRAQLFYLAEFTEKHSQEVLRNEASPAALIDINTAVMRGLNGHEGG